jgi:hypothetical protein
MWKCTLSDTKESKQIRRTVDQYGLVHDRVKAYQQAKLPQSQAKRSEPVISTSTLKVVKRKPSAEFLRAADRVAVAPDSVNRSLSSEPWFARVDQHGRSARKSPVIRGSSLTHTHTSLVQK